MSDKANFAVNDPISLVPSEAKDHIEWRVKGLPTYLVHGLQEK